MVNLLFIWWQGGHQKDVYELYMNGDLVLKGGDSDYMYVQEKAYRKALNDVGVFYHYKREIRSLLNNEILLPPTTVNNRVYDEIKQEDSLVKKHEEARKKEE